MRCICARHFVFVGALLQVLAIAIAQCHDLCLWTEAQSRQMYVATDSSHTDHTNANLRLVHTVFLSCYSVKHHVAPFFSPGKRRRDQLQRVRIYHFPLCYTSCSVEEYDKSRTP